MQVDPDSLDPQLRTARFNAIASAALGLISLCVSIIPVCGGVASILGVILGFSSLKTEQSKTAIAGVIISILGLVITVTYAAFLLFFKK
jgi:hypothetical protein